MAWGPSLALLAAALLLGLLLAAALTTATQTPVAYTPDTEPGSSASPVANPENLPAVDPLSVGADVPGVVAGSIIAPQADFDVGACLHDIGITDSTVGWSQVFWTPTERNGWLIVYSDRPAAVVREDGGIVNAVVVTDTCGSPAETGLDQGDARSAVLWHGQVTLSTPE